METTETMRHMDANAQKAPICRVRGVPIPQWHPRASPCHRIRLPQRYFCVMASLFTRAESLGVMVMLSKRPLIQSLS